MDFTIKQHNLGTYHIPQDTKGGRCLEIGANVGSFFSTHKDHFKTIHYYEPVKQCFDICKEKSDKYSNVKGFNLAGYHTSNKQVNLINHSSRTAGSIAVEEFNNGDWLDEEVIASPTTISLEDMVKKFRSKNIDYLKLDCENSEYNILLNKDLTPFKYIAMELHWQMGRDRWYELLDYISLTHTLNYGRTVYKPNSNTEIFWTRK